MILPPDLKFNPPRLPKGWKAARTAGYLTLSTGQVLRRDRIGKRRLTKAEKKAEKLARQAERRRRVQAAVNEARKLNDAIEKVYLSGPKLERDDIVTPEDVEEAS